MAGPLARRHGCLPLGSFHFLRVLLRRLRLCLCSPAAGQVARTGPVQATCKKQSRITLPAPWLQVDLNRLLRTEDLGLDRLEGTLQTSPPC